MTSMRRSALRLAGMSAMVALVGAGTVGCAAQVNLVAPGSQQALSQKWQNAKSTYSAGNLTLSVVSASDATAWPLFSTPTKAHVHVATPSGSDGELRLKNWGTTPLLVVLTSPEKTGSVLVEANRMARLDASVWQQAVGKAHQFKGPVSVALYSYPLFKETANGSYTPVGQPVADVVLEFDTLAKLKERQVAWPKGFRPASAGDEPMKIRPF